MNKSKEAEATKRADSAIRQSESMEFLHRCFMPIERIESLTADILHYLSYLNTKYHVTIHALDWATKCYLRQFLSFNSKRSIKHTCQ